MTQPVQINDQPIDDYIVAGVIVSCVWLRRLEFDVSGSSGQCVVSLEKSFNLYKRGRATGVNAYRGSVHILMYRFLREYRATRGLPTRAPELLPAYGDVDIT